ncbi:MAG TPA: T9SS type A sorting domain-containing protein, partial [Rubricoccaceae bacterium]
IEPLRAETGGEDLLVAGSSGVLLRVRGVDGQTVWSAGGLGSSVWDVALGGRLGGPPIVYVGSTRSEVVALNGGTGATVWTAEMGGQVFGVATVFDVDDDDHSDVVAVGTGGVAFLFSGDDGAELWRYTFSGSGFDGAGEAVTAVPDLDGDGVPEVAFGTRDGRVVLLYGGGGLPGTDAEGTPAAAAVTLDAPFPNPTTGPVTLRYRQGTEGAVRLAVYDALGRAVWAHAPGRQPAGSYAVSGPSGLAAGVYVVRLEAGGDRATRRLVVVR